MNDTKVCTLLLLKRDEDILLAMKKRGFGADRWNGVGGKVDAGETIEQALVRECQEEILVTPESFDKVAVHTFLFPDGTADMEVHAYICDEWTGEPAETEEMAPRWFNRADIPYMNMWQDDIVWLPLVLQGKKLLGKFTFDHDENMTRAELELVESVV